MHCNIDFPVSMLPVRMLPVRILPERTFLIIMFPGLFLHARSTFTFFTMIILILRNSLPVFAAV